MCELRGGLVSVVLSVSVVTEMERRHQPIDKCCFCVNIKVGAVIIVLIHLIPYINTVYLLRSSDPLILYIAIGLLVNYTVATILYFVALSCWKKAFLHIPYMVLYAFTTILDNVIAVFSIGNKNVSVALEVLVFLIAVTIDIYLFVVLYSMYIKIWNEEMEDTE